MISKYTEEDLIKSLPHDKPRRGQTSAIRFALESWDSGKRFVMLEAPTGAGKSAMGLGISTFYKDCYYLTIQKLLQQQIIRDYARMDMVELRGKNAYPCTYYDIHANNKLMKSLTLDNVMSKKDEQNCAAGYCKKFLGKNKCPDCFPYKNASEDEVQAFKAKHGVSFSTCPYFEQVNLAMESPRVLMNFSSFLYQTQFTSRFGERDLLVIDEGHHCESQLMDFITLTISDLLFKGRGIELPDYETPEQYAMWFHENKIDIEIGRLIFEAKNLGDQKAEDEALSMYHKYMRFMKSIERSTDWVCEYKEHSIGKSETYGTVVLKPVFINDFSEEMLFSFGKKVLIMSATILDAGIMAKSLGIKKDDIAFFRMDNYFPKENRPIYLQTVAKMTGGKDKMSAWAKPLVDKVDQIVEHHSGERGIIHTHNFAIAELLMQKSEHSHRFLYQRNFKDKEVMLVEHGNRKDSVIIAPAMHEGLDLKDDLSRFQIITKVPYPNFFDDKQLYRRVELDRRYLTWLVALKLVQSYGRSIRSAEDWANTYIIDESIYNFISDANGMLPKWFKEALIKPSSR